ncbi:MAG: BrxA/BrxB family bacilliredoxin [Candidatus Woesearchaeota archaeon]
MYPTELTQPMKEVLLQAEFGELTTPQDVDNVLQKQEGTLLLFINSVCGCSGQARPAVIAALEMQPRPQHFVTVFAGVDTEATERARSYITGYGPSSPAIALFKDGNVVAMMQRHDIQGKQKEEIMRQLHGYFEVHCQ